MTTIDLGIVFDLDAQTRLQAIELSHRIGREFPSVNLLGDENIPHITLFQGRFPRNNLERVYEFVEGLQYDYPPIMVALDKGLFVRKNLNVFWVASISPKLKELHLDIADHLFPLTDNLLMDQFSALLNSSSITQLERERLKSYGMLLSGDGFMPHVTLGRLINPSDAAKLQKLEVPQSAFEAQSVVVGELGYYGNLTKVLYQIMLAGR